MHKSALGNVTPKTTIYSLSDVFTAVEQDIERYQHAVSQAPDWGKGQAGEALLQSLQGIRGTLSEWADQGVAHIVTDAPFSDGAITPVYQNLITEQFRENRVRPLRLSF